MAKKKFTLSFEGLEEYIQKLESLGENIKPVVNDCLEATHALVTKQAHESMVKHRRSGRTEGSIKDNAEINWEGHIASIDAGFDIANGGLASVFLMYGTPRMKKDTKVYNAIYGVATRKKVAELQKEIFSKAIQERM